MNNKLNFIELAISDDDSAHQLDLIDPIYDCVEYDEEQKNK